MASKLYIIYSQILPIQDCFQVGCFKQIWRPFSDQKKTGDCLNEFKKNPTDKTMTKKDLKPFPQKDL